MIMPLKKMIFIFPCFYGKIQNIINTVLVMSERMCVCSIWNNFLNIIFNSTNSKLQGSPRPDSVVSQSTHNSTVNSDIKVFTVKGQKQNSVSDVEYVAIDIKNEEKVEIKKEENPLKEVVIDIIDEAEISENNLEKLKMEPIDSVIDIGKLREMSETSLDFSGRTDIDEKVISPSRRNSMGPALKAPYREDPENEFIDIFDSKYFAIYNNLKVIRSIKSGSKYAVNAIGELQTDDGYFQSMRRGIIGYGRDKTYNCIMRTIKISLIIKNNNSTVNALFTEELINGLKNLKLTYKTDEVFCGKIDGIIEIIKSNLS